MASNYYIENGKSLFKFRSGLVVRIKQVSPLLVQELRKANPRPVAPVQRILGADGETYIEEMNVAAPSYVAAVEQYEAMIEEKARIILVKLGVDFDMTPAQRAELDQRRAFMRDEFGVELDKNDVYSYVAYIAMSGEEEYGELINAVLSRSTPTESEVASALESFSSRVQG